MSLRALGGGELWGDKLVRIVYLDEAGTSSRQQEPFAVVAGVIVHGDQQLMELRLALQQIMSDHIPESDRKTLVLHTCDIYGGTGYFDKKRKPEWDWDRRAAILRDLAALPQKLNLYVTWGPIQKTAFPFSRLRESGAMATDLQLIVGAAYMMCMLEVDIWFRQNARGENCIVIVEDNKDTRQFVRAMHQQYQDPDILNKLTVLESDKPYFPLRHIQEDPGFQEKRVAHPLVLADFIAYFIKRRVMGDERSFEFSSPWHLRTAGLHTDKLRPR